MLNKIFNKEELSWILYDWANSVYATNIMAAIFPIYFTTVCNAAADGTAGIQWWGIGTSVATLIVAILGPVLGSLADCKGMKKKLWGGFVLLGVLFTLMMAIFDSWQLMLVGYIISFIGFQGSVLYYDSFLTDITTRERMDKISSWGFAAGYIGGSTIAFIISIAFMLILGMDNPLGVKVAVVITSLWWAIFSIPMLKNVKQKYFKEDEPQQVIKNTFGNLAKTLKSIGSNKGILFFMIAYFFYIDGVGTVISMATSYGTTLKLGTIGLIGALLVTQIVAIPFSILFGSLVKKIKAFKLIGFAIVVYIIIVTIGFYMGYSVETNNFSKQAISNATVLFWIMACLVGTVQGGIQSLSRAQFGKMVPANKSNEYFGFFDIFGKFASIMGPAIVSTITALTGRASFGVLSIIFQFVVGGLIILINYQVISNATIKID
ncbi:MAG: MFS transporter [Erysipelotrichaceae bacterium]